MVRKLETGKLYKYVDEKGNIWNEPVHIFNDVWVDENNFLHNEPNKPSKIEYSTIEKTYKKIIVYREHGILHNLFGPALIGYRESFYVIHGNLYNKDDWEIESNRLLMLEDIECKEN